MLLNANDNPAPNINPPLTIFKILSGVSPSSKACFIPLYNNQAPPIAIETPAAILKALPRLLINPILSKNFKMLELIFHAKKPKPTASIYGNRFFNFFSTSSKFCVKAPVSAS